MDRSGERERAGVVGRDRRARVRAAGERTRVQDHRCRVRHVGLADERAVDVELEAARRTLALEQVQLAGRFELEAQLVPARRAPHRRIPP